jgi:hypothetical protein
VSFTLYVRLGTAAALPGAAVVVAPVDPDGLVEPDVLVLEVLLLLPQPATPTAATAKPRMSSLERMENLLLGVDAPSPDAAGASISHSALPRRA